MQIQWDDARLLLVALEAGSLSAAARKLGIGQATMSRRLAALEAAVGHALVERSRAGLKLTRMGERLRPRFEALREDARRLEAAIESLDTSPRGRVRLAVPPGVAADVLAPLVPEIRLVHPDLRLTILASPRVVDLDADEADLAVRLVRPTSGDLVSQHLGSVEWRVQSSAAYRGQLPARPRLADLDWITWPRSSGIASRRWLDAALPDNDPILEADDFLVQRAAAQQGIGVVVHGPSAHLVPIEVVDAPEMPVAHAYLVARRSLAEVPRVRAIMDLVVPLARRLLAG